LLLFVDVRNSRQDFGPVFVHRFAGINIEESLSQIGFGLTVFFPLDWAVFCASDVISVHQIEFHILRGGNVEIEVGSRVGFVALP